MGPYVAGFPEYFEPLARHLLLIKLRHWEKALRELAAAALAGDHPVLFTVICFATFQYLQTCNIPSLAALAPHRPAYCASSASPLLPLLLPLT